MRLLLVEDDSSLAEGILTSLKGEGYTLDWLQDGASALHALSSEPFDLAILDLGLPRMDGLQVLRELRDRHQAVPVLVLTARDGVQDRIAGLDAGDSCYFDHVPLWNVARENPGPCLRAHTQLSRSGGGALGLGLISNVDHRRATLFIEMGEVLFSHDLRSVAR